MILACQSVSKSFGVKEVLKNIQFHIEDHEKAALVGINGAGKSTLLKIIIGEESADSGQVTLGKDKTIGYLAQQQEHSYQHTIYEEMLSVKQHIIELDQQIRDNKDRIIFFFTDTYLNCCAIFLCNHSMKGKWKCHPLIFLDSTIIMGIHIGKIQRLCLQE